ncbi:hypothetical protein SAMN06265218_107119 [Fodinibius sediminis]|uniref:Uncharacterized protein n=1 Tax=Fodinibius sediminis TaxID=1214077 RepID=A0A521CW62_9BACT|nr:hypothetical protein SAMN06265218_107119 [Fodinibius sediminis]
MKFSACNPFWQNTRAIWQSIVKGKRFLSSTDNIRSFNTYLSFSGERNGIPAREILN